MGYKADIIKKKIYYLTVKNITPISTMDQYEELKRDPVDNKLYIPGTSIAGAFRNYTYKNNRSLEKELFGDKEGKLNRVTFYDAKIKENKELAEGTRPGIKIDNEYGITAKGAKFDRKFIHENCEFDFKIELTAYTEKDIKNTEKFKEIIDAFLLGEIALGANKTSGYGRFETINYEVIEYDFTSLKGLFDYILNKKEDITSVKLDKSQIKNNIISFYLNAETKTPLLIMSENYSEGPDNINIENYEEKKIIPGTSIKGALRARCEMIINSLGIDNVILNEMFGFEKQKNNKSQISKVTCFDSVIENCKPSLYHNIHIDTFTGGVIDGALMDEEVVMGEVEIKVEYKDENKEKNKIGLLLLALRDLATGDMTLGSGYGKGRGVFEGKTLKVDFRGEEYIEIDFNNINNTEIEKLNKYVSEVKSNG